MYARMCACMHVCMYLRTVFSLFDVASTYMWVCSCTYINLGTDSEWRLTNITCGLVVWPLPLVEAAHCGDSAGYCEARGEQRSVHPGA